jgi:hypothetical protein
MFSENDINNIEDEWESFCDDEKAQKEEDNTGSSYRNDDLLKKRGNKEINIPRNNQYEPHIQDPIGSASLGSASLGSASLGEIVSSKLYISTTTIISYLNTSIDISSLFWKIPIIGYSSPTEGVIKKQMKFILNSQEELDEITKKREMYEYTSEFIINKCSKNSKKDLKDIKKKGGRQQGGDKEQAAQSQQTQAQETQAQQQSSKIKYIRKISIGICKKDIKSYRCKQKGAFMNCFVVILRILINDTFKEIHVKVFNTGKLEIPGIQSSAILNDVLILLVKLLRPYVSDTLDYLPDKSETVLINSNFNCGYYINREKLYEILKHKYNINSVYDPCSYPGIQCEIYYNTTLKIQKNIEESSSAGSTKTEEDKKNNYKISFMVFRTGSVLIVGKCNETILYELYDFLCDILKKEYLYIKNSQKDTKKKEVLKNLKIRKIYISA